MEFDKAGVERSVSESATGVCLIKPGCRVYQWSLQQISEFVVPL